MSKLPQKKQKCTITEDPTDEKMKIVGYEIAEQFNRSTNEKRLVKH